MADKTSREENCGNKGMEEESRSDEPLQKTDTVLNECQDNFGNVLVKEEHKSVIETDHCYSMEAGQINHSVVERSEPVNSEVVIPAQIPVQMPAQVIIQIPAQMPIQVPVQEVSVTENSALAGFEKKKRHHRQKKNSSKQTCDHGNKTFVILKRRMRCDVCLAVMCPECQSGVKSTLSNHLATSDNKNTYFYHCRLCRLVFKTNCAYQAHSRIHGLSAPYVCPDCGSIYKSAYNLSLHLINKCCHVYKIMRGGCEVCLRHNMAVRDYLTHIEQAHVKPIFKCSRCECVNDNGKALEQHFQRNHRFERTLCVRYFSCSVCENLVFSEHIYCKHLEYHKDYSTVFKIGYLCSCNQSFNTVRLLRAHLEGCSRKGVIPPQWSFLQRTLRTSKMHQTENNQANPDYQDSEADITDGDSEEGEFDIDPTLEFDFEIDDGDDIDEEEDGEYGDYDDDESRAVLEFLQEEGSSSSTCLSDVSSYDLSSASGSITTVFSDATSNLLSSPSMSRPIYSDGSSEPNSESSGKETDDGEGSLNELTFKEFDDNADGAVDNADGEIGNIDREVDNADGEVDNANREIDNADGEIDNADRETDNADGETDNADGEIDNADRETDNADGETDNADGETDNADGETDNADGETDNADGETDNTDGEVDNADGEIDNADGEIDNTDGEVDNADGEIDNTDGEVDNADGEVDNADGEIDNTDGEIDETGSDRIFPKSPEQSLDGREEQDEIAEKSGLGMGGSPQNNERELSSGQDEQINQESPLIPIVDLDEELSLEPQGGIISQSPQEKEKGEGNEKADGDGEKDENVLYDHIPCDHLGYLKVQEKELREKNKKKKSAKTSEGSESPVASGSDNFVVTSVLDEKTGFMKTKRVLIPRSELDKRNPNQFRANPGGSNESLSRDVMKTKNSTFFSCPFCSVLFPKHSSSFQKFRLHMECYHSDASLDIDVDRSGAPRSETKFAVVGKTTENSDNTSDEDSGDLDDMDLGTRMGIVVESNEEDRDDRNVLSNGSGSSESEEKNKENISLKKIKNKSNGAGKGDVEMKLVNEQNKEEKRMESNKPRSANKARKNSDTRKVNESTGSLVKPSLIQKIVQSKNTNLNEQNPVKFVLPERDFKNIAYTEGAACATNSRKYLGEDNSTGNLEMSRNFTVNFATTDENVSAENSITLHRNQVGILNHKSKRMQDNDSVHIPQKNEPKEGAQKARRRRRKSSKSSGSELDNLSLCSRATLEKEHFAKSSPESLKTPTKEIESGPQNAENSNDVDMNGGSPEQGNPRKESDVWSEFYKTLKVAETLKKTNVKDRENLAIEEASILANYTNKRVVKKPKRYRESSDTEESEDEKQSPNFSRSSDKADEDDETTTKKKDLIKRLENVDYRILDYVVNLLEIKDKNQVSAKKDKDESLKSSKKKMSSGMKSAGKQLKPLIESDFQDDDGEPKNKGKQNKGKRQKKQKKDKKKGEVEDKKENDKDQEKDKEQEQGQSRDQGRDQDQDRNQDENKEQGQEKENEERGNGNGRGKDKGKDDDEDKDKKDKKGKDKAKAKAKAKDKDKEKDKDNKDSDKDREKDINDLNVGEASWELQTEDNPEDKNGDKKRRRRKKSEPLVVKERRSSGYEGDVNPTERKSGQGDGEGSSNKKKRRMSSKSQHHRRVSVSPESNEFSSGQVISTRAFEADRKLTCAVCKENLPNEAEFKDHIQSHRIDENNYQCMECGECFVVRPSLEKHLHAYHKIKDVQKYIEENKCSTPQKNEDSDSEPLKENQCKVCRDEFPTVQDLNKHFRIHGMAFLQQVKKEARHH